MDKRASTFADYVSGCMIIWCTSRRANQAKNVGRVTQHVYNHKPILKTRARWTIEAKKVCAHLLVNGEQAHVKVPSWDLSTWFICCGYLWFGGGLRFSPHSREGGASLLRDWAYRQSGQGSVRINQEAGPLLSQLSSVICGERGNEYLMRTMQLESAL